MRGAILLHYIFSTYSTRADIQWVINKCLLIEWILSSSFHRIIDLQSQKPPQLLTIPFIHQKSCGITVTKWSTNCSWTILGPLWLPEPAIVQGSILMSCSSIHLPPNPQKRNLHPSLLFFMLHVSSALDYSHMIILSTFFWMCVSHAQYSGQRSEL